MCHSHSLFHRIYLYNVQSCEPERVKRSPIDFDFFPKQYKYIM